MGEHLVPGLGPALRLEIGEQGGGVAQPSRIELQTDESGEGLLRRSGRRAAATQRFPDLIAAGQMRAGLVDDDIDPAGDDGEQVLQGGQCLLLVVSRRRVEQALSDVVAEVGDVRRVDVRGHVLDLRGIDLEALCVTGQHGLDLGAEPRRPFEQREVGQLLGGEVDADLRGVDVDIGGEGIHVGLDEHGGVVRQKGQAHLGAGEHAFGQRTDGLADLHGEHRIAHRSEHRRSACEDALHLCRHLGFESLGQSRRHVLLDRQDELLPPRHRLLDPVGAAQRAGRAVGHGQFGRLGEPELGQSEGIGRRPLRFLGHRGVGRRHGLLRDRDGLGLRVGALSEQSLHLIHDRRHHRRIDLEALRHAGLVLVVALTRTGAIGTEEHPEDLLERILLVVVVIGHCSTAPMNRFDIHVNGFICGKLPNSRRFRRMFAPGERSL